jgi:hypothetical protein
MGRTGWLFWCGGAAGVLVFGLTGCSPEPRSPIVTMVENAGAGDMRTAPVGAMVQWFNKHPDVAMEADKLCKRARENALAKWPETTEGRVCNAAAQVAGFIQWRRDLQTNNDHKTFQGGSK